MASHSCDSWRLVPPATKILAYMIEGIASFPFTKLLMWILFNFFQPKLAELAKNEDLYLLT